MPKSPKPEDVQAFHDEIARIAERDGISIEEAAENFSNLLVNIRENDKVIYTLRIGFEDLVKRVEALEAKIPS